LNISANRARYLAYAGRTVEALRLIDASIADAKQWGGGVNRDALAAMHLERICFLGELGRSNEAAPSLATVEQLGSPTQLASANLCLDQYDAAVKALLSGLEQRHWRSAVLAYVQTTETDSLPSDYARRQHARSDRLRSDPRILARVREYGRLLPWRLRDSAPPEGPQEAAPDDDTA
jgi:hypothetical protein